MKKLARYLVIAVLVVWVMTDPTGAAAVVHSAITGIQSLAHSLSAFAASVRR